MKNKLIIVAIVLLTLGLLGSLVGNGILYCLETQWQTRAEEQASLTEQANAIIVELQNQVDERDIELLTLADTVDELQGQVVREVRISDSLREQLDSSRLERDILGDTYVAATISYVSYETIRAFIRQDQTQNNRYVDPTYVCHDFARDVCEHARTIGIPCAVVIINFVGEEVGHAFVAFSTTDRGIVYFEPQTDEAVSNPLFYVAYWGVRVERIQYHWEEWAAY
jgi:hypothetical protein